MQLWKRRSPHKSEAVLHAHRSGVSSDCFGDVQKTTGDRVRLDLAGIVGGNLAMKGANAMLFREIDMLCPSSAPPSAAP